MWRCGDVEMWWTYGLRAERNTGALKSESVMSSMSDRIYIYITLQQSTILQYILVCQCK